MSARMMNLIHELWWLKRDIVSDGYDRALARLAAEIPMTIHEFASGTRCWTWTVPEKWSCEEAYVETLDGVRVIDAADHPLHVVSYSLPFDGVVSREELLQHLHVHPTRPDAIPFVFQYYQRDWGVCATQTLRASLNEASYRVVIRSAFESGSLKVGEVIIPGESEETFMLAAHLCHPAMVNDDLTGVVVGLEVARALLAGPKPHYTYRLLLLPETIGSVAYLSHHEKLIPSMVGGLFLEMLGNDAPHALQLSYSGDSQVDRCLGAAFASGDPAGEAGAYRTVINNDERQFNGPGVRVPMLSLSRVEECGRARPPYPEYHSSDDTPAIVSAARLESSRDLTLALLRAFDDNQYVINNFKGEVFCSGHGLWIDHQVNPDGHRQLFRIMDACDGAHTIADIADELDIGFQAVHGVVAALQSKGLVSLSRRPQPTDPHLLRRPALRRPLRLPARPPARVQELPASAEPTM